MRSFYATFPFVGASCAALVLAGCASDVVERKETETSGSSAEAISAAPVRTTYRNVTDIAGAPGEAGSAPTDARCREVNGVPCYTPQQIRTAYGMAGLIDAGYDGTGQTIVIIDSYGSPTIEADLKQYDADYGLPDPPSFEIRSPLGTVPFDPNDRTMRGWAFETTMDVEWAHAMAPGAKIVLLTSPVAETQGLAGLPEFLALHQYALDNHLGSVLSLSWAATENTLMDEAGRKMIASFEEVFKRARREHVTVLVAAGDWGPSGHESDDTTFFPYPVVSYPSSSPNVTAIGGTSLTADGSGNYQSEIVWNDEAGATGGGVSQIFTEPVWQRLLPQAQQQTLAGRRGIPDVAFNADPYSAALVYLSYPGARKGYHWAGGTSEGAPQWAGIIADFNQLAGRPLGYLNDKLYLLGALGLLKPMTHDVTSGNNTYLGVTGYEAASGWDLVTGWGTPALGQLGQLLAGMADAQ